MYSMKIIKKGGNKKSIGAHEEGMNERGREGEEEREREREREERETKERRERGRKEEREIESERRGERRADMQIKIHQNIRKDMIHTGRLTLQVHAH